LKKFNIKDFNPNIAFFFNLLLDEKTTEFFGKKLIPVPVMQFNLVFSAKNKNEFKEKILFFIDKNQNLLKDIEKILLLHNINIKKLYANISIHYCKLEDKEDLNENKIFHYRIQMPFDEFINRLDDIYNDLQNFINLHSYYYYLTIKELLKVYKKEIEFISCLEKIKGKN